MAATEYALYFKVVVSGKPTERDDTGCDGLYIESVDDVTCDIKKLKDELHALHNWKEDYRNQIEVLEQNVN